MMVYIVSCQCGSCVFFFKQKTAYEMRISDWSSDVCLPISLDAQGVDVGFERAPARKTALPGDVELRVGEFGLGIGFAELVEMTLGLLAEPLEIGRASCRERGCKYV